MAYEILVGVNVVDEAGYEAYRQGMYPILKRFGGDFILDLDISRLRKNPLTEPVNRVFTIRFASQESKDAFFRDEDYLAIRRQYFEPSVNYSGTIAHYSVS